MATLFEPVPLGGVFRCLTPENLTSGCRHQGSPHPGCVNEVLATVERRDSSLRLSPNDFSSCVYRSRARRQRAREPRSDVLCRRRAEIENEHTHRLCLVFSFPSNQVFRNVDSAIVSPRA
jgi:hypothetical protein